MKRFFYLSGSLFFLALTLLIGVHLGAMNARADHVDLSGPGEIIAGDGSTVVWDRAGQGWTVREPGRWIRTPQIDFPVPASEVKLVGGTYLITTSDEGWVRSPTGTWVSVGVYPGGAIAVESTTWGSLKQKFVK
jgi:hypothetical protein